MKQTSASPIWLYRFAVGVVFATLLLILAGGLVTSHEAGLAVPDWPRSYGQWMPPMVGNVFWEHGHRMIAGAVGLLTLLLTIFVQRLEKRPAVKKLAWAALGAVFLQALLGGLTVILLLPAPVSIFHACLAQTFFCLLIALAFFLRPEADAPKETQTPALLFKLLTLTTGFIYLQLILGAIVRHTAKGTPYHAGWAFFVLALIFFSVRAVILHLSERKGCVRAATVLGLLAITQFFLGIGAFLYTHVLRNGDAPPTTQVLFTAMHQTNGAIILGLSLLLTLMVRE